MGRNKLYTSEYYDEVALLLSNKMGRDSYTKIELLTMVGFVSKEGEVLTQHWPKLRRAMGRIGITMCYTDGRNWHIGANGQDGNMVEMAHQHVKRLVIAFRPDVIRALQNGDDADTVVASLANKGLDPMSFIMYCRHAGQELPGSIETELVSSTQRMLPELPAAMQDQIKSLGYGMKQIAGLLDTG